MTAKKRRQRLAGVDVSAKDLHVAFEDDEVGVFENTPAGHKRLVKALTKRGAQARVLVEATSTYHLDLCLTLANHVRIEVMVANPRATRHFHQAQGIRAKTDRVDAKSLLSFLLCMPFTPWTPPEPQVLELRTTGRYIGQLVKEQTRMKNQLAALRASSAGPAWVLSDLESRLTELAARIEAARSRAIEVARNQPEVWRHVQHLTGIDGIGVNTAVRLVGEFLVLDTEMTSKEITAWAGLDPRPRESGTSVRGRRSISKRGNARVRALLYMPALSVSRMTGSLGDFYRRVEARSGHGSVALTAVMRKLLTVSWAVFRADAPWDATRVLPKPPNAEAA